MLEMRKYKEAGVWGNWKPVTKEVADRKVKVMIDDLWGGKYCPYQVREVKEAGK